MPGKLHTGCEVIRVMLADDGLEVHVLYGMVATLSMFPKKICQKFAWCLAVPIYHSLCVFGGREILSVKAISLVGEPNPAEAGKGSALDRCAVVAEGCSILVEQFADVVVGVCVWEPYHSGQHSEFKQCLVYWHHQLPLPMSSIIAS